MLVYSDEMPNGALGQAIIDAAIVLNHKLDAKRCGTEIRSALSAGWGFLPNALKGPKIWLVGSEADLLSIPEAA